MIALIMVLIAFIVNWQILREWEYGIPDKPILLAFQSDDGTKIQRVLKLISPEGIMVNNSMTMEVIQRELYQRNCAAVFYRIPQEELDKLKFSQRTKKMLHILGDAFNTGICGQKLVTATPIIISAGRIPVEYYERFTIIPIDYDLEELPEFLKKYQGCDENLWNISKVAEKKTSWIYNAYSFWYFQLNSKFDESLYMKYYKELEKVEELVNVHFDKEDLLTILEIVFMDYVNRDCAPVHYVGDLDNGIQDLESGLFWRDNYLYIQDALFKGLMGNVYEEIEINEVKRHLYEIGVLLGRKGDYSSKMNISTNEGLQRFRMLKFDLDYMPSLKNIISEEEKY